MKKYGESTPMKSLVYRLTWPLSLLTITASSGCAHFDDQLGPVPPGISLSRGMMPSATEFSDWKWKQANPAWKPLPGDPQR